MVREKILRRVEPAQSPRKTVLEKVGKLMALMRPPADDTPQATLGGKLATYQPYPNLKLECRQAVRNFKRPLFCSEIPPVPLLFPRMISPPGHSTSPRIFGAIAAFFVVVCAGAQPLTLTPLDPTGIYDLGEKAGWTVAFAPQPT